MSKYIYSLSESEKVQQVTQLLEEVFGNKTVTGKQRIHKVHLSGRFIFFDLYGSLTKHHIEKLKARNLNFESTDSVSREVFMSMVMLAKSGRFRYRKEADQE